jgi:hypothetical protein
LLVPGARVFFRRRVGVRAIGETAVAVVVTAARITDVVFILEAMTQVPVVGEAVAEDDDLGKIRSRLGEAARKKNAKGEEANRDGKSTQEM